MVTSTFQREKVCWHVLGQQGQLNGYNTQRQENNDSEDCFDENRKKQMTEVDKAGVSIG